MGDKRIVKVFSLVMVTIMMVGTFLSVSHVTLASSMLGSGTEDDPYLVGTVEDLYSIEDNLQSHYKLTNDLDLEYQMWQPISRFTGVFDGNNCTIYNLNVEGGGFFERLANATIKNITFKDAKVVSKYGSTGVICGSADYSSFIRCIVIDSEIKTKINWIGNIAGSAHDSTLFQCYSNSDIHANTYVKYSDGCIGGLVGLARGTRLSQCFTTGDISGNSSIGGLVGGSSFDGAEAYIDNSYSTGTVTVRDIDSGDEWGVPSGYGANLISGVIGDITNSYAVGNVTALTRSGLTRNGEIINSYYNQDVLQLENPDSNARTTEQMYQISNYEGWDFETIWFMEQDDYPRLRFELEVNLPELRLKSIALEQTEAILSVGESLPLNVIFTPKRAGNKNVTFISTNPAAFTVDEYGIITAISSGFGGVLVFSEEGNYMLCCNVFIN